jgi:acetyl esterase/lipase
MVTRREVALRGLAAIAAMPTADAAAAGVGGLKGNADPDELLRYVDPELRAFLRTLPPDTPASAAQVQQSRQNPDQSANEILPAGVVARAIPGPPGGPAVRIFIVGSSDGGRLRPALLYTHGGGYIGGNTASSWPKFSGLQKIAQDHDCVVVSVDYRLAPETHFPGALEDCYAALKWLQANANALGADPKRIAIMGESAGGGLAATLAIAARDRGEIPIIFQLLIYPMLDDRTGSTREPAPHIGRFIWSRQSNRFGWSSLLGVPAGSPNVPRGAVPARVTDLRGLPPTYIGVGSIDLFVDEDMEYARRLVDAGVPTEFYLAPGAYHGFFFLAPDAAVSKRFADSYNAALARAFATAT